MPKRGVLPSRSRASLAGLDGGSVVIWSVFVGTALPTAFAREAGTVWTLRGIGRSLKRELIRLCLRRAMPSRHFNYVYTRTGDVFVRKAEFLALVVACCERT